jgi:paraquat-inducible protein A
MGSMAALIACEGCDLLHRREPIPPGSRATCARCGHELDLGHSAPDRVLPLALAGLVLLAVANLAPFMSFAIGSFSEVNLVVSGPFELARQGFHGLALLVALTTLIVPALRLGSLAWVMLALRRGLDTPGARLALRLVGWLREWTMLDIFLLGALVARVKLADMAQVQMESGFWACAALVLVSSAALSAFDPHEAWNRLEPPT